MHRLEQKCWDFLLRHRLTLLVAFAAVGSLYVRYTMRGIVTGDMADFLNPWYDAIKAGGGLASLSAQVGNYNIPYQTLIALATYLPLPREAAYKAVSVLFDYALSAALALGVLRFTGSRGKAALAWSVTVCLPSVVLNSAAWGQCDAIYTFFLVMCFVFLMRGRFTGAMLFFGAAFAFKLQAVFFLPFLLFYYVQSRKFSALRFLLIPLPILFLSLGGLVQGRSLGDLFTVYFNQMNEYPRISLCYPSFWNLLVENSAKDNADRYLEMYRYCILITVLLLAVGMLWLLRRKQLDRRALTMTACAMLYTCVLFLPAMHDRYSYPALIFAVLACFLCPRMIPVALGMVIVDLQTYGFYIFGKVPASWELLVAENLLCYAGTVWLTARACLVPEAAEPRKAANGSGKDPDVL